MCEFSCGEKGVKSKNTRNVSYVFRFTSQNYFVVCMGCIMK
jgi:hypothetical protein